LTRGSKECILRKSKRREGGEDLIGSIMVVFRFTSINPIIIFPINNYP